MLKRKLIKRALMGSVAGVIGATGVTTANAAVSSQGLPPAANSYRSFEDGSIVRDSGLNQPLDLLNDFYPAIEINITDRDNIRRRSDLEEDDLVITANPSLAYRTNIGRHQFYAAYSGIFTFHDELDQEDAESNTLNVQLGLDLARLWDLKLFAGLGNSFEQRGISGTRPFGQFIPGSDENGPDEIDYNFYGADLIYGRKASPLVAVLGFEKYTTSYKNNFQGNSNSTGSRDRDSDSLHLDLAYEIGAKTSVFGRLQLTDTDYDRSVNSLDSEQTDFILGLRWKPSNALSGVIGLGNSDKDFDEPNRGDYDGTTYYVNLNYMINPFSTLELSASRAVEEPGDEQSDFYESDLLGIGWNHAINPKLVFNAFAKWIDDDYDTNREDEFFDFGIGLDYVWRPWLSAGIYYGEIERKSTDAAVAYEDTYFGIRIRSDLRTLLQGRGSRVEPDSFDYPGPTNGSQR